MWIKALNYMIVTSGAAALFYARKLKSSRKAQKEFLHEEMMLIDTEFTSRKNYPAKAGYFISDILV